MRRLVALGLAALASAQHPWSPPKKHEDVDLAADEERVYETFFDSVVIPARDAVKEKLAEPITVGASNASEIANLECAADALTTRIVAHATDYRDRYCGACEFEDQPRCTFCHCSKLSVFRRMPLVRMARELLTLRPTISATRSAKPRSCSRPKRSSATMPMAARRSR